MLGKLGSQSIADSHNEALQHELESYREDKNFHSMCVSFELLGYENLTGEVHKPFTIVLRQKLQEQYPHAEFTEVRWNTYCAYVFEMLLQPKKNKSIF